MQRLGSNGLYYNDKGCYIHGRDIHRGNGLRQQSRPGPNATSAHLRFDDNNKPYAVDGLGIRKRERSIEHAYGGSGTNEKSENVKRPKIDTSLSSNTELRIKGASLASQQRQTESYEDQLEDDELNIISSVLPLAINQGRDIKTDKSRPRSDVEPLSTGNSSETTLPTSSRSSLLGVDFQTFKDLFGSGSLGFSAGRGHSTSRQDDIQDPNQEQLEALAQSRSEIKHLEEELAKLKGVVEKSEQDLKTTRNEAEALRFELEKASLELDSTRMQIQRLEASHATHQHEQAELMSGCNRLKTNRAKMESRIETLVREKGSLSRQLKQALVASENEKKKVIQTDFVVDAFDDSPDQVSEANIKSSLESINDAVDTLVANTLDKTASMVEKHLGRERNAADLDGLNSYSEALTTALALPTLTEENRGLLLDAVLHHVITMNLSGLFFKSNVTTFWSDNQVLLERLFDNLCQTETWRVCQRWRALVASSVFREVTPSFYEEYAIDLTANIIKIISLAYGLPFSNFEELKPMIKRDVVAVCRDAHLLSVVSKRDLQSVRAGITITSISKWNPEHADAVWPEMGVEKGDPVIGQYNLGLYKLDEAGRKTYLALPKVTTSALIREVQRM